MRSRHKRQAADPRRRFIDSARVTACKSGVPFCITVDDIVIPKRCPALGFRLVGSGFDNNAPSLDRLVPKLGYVPGNVRVISFRANRIKNNATPVELCQIAAWLQEQLK